MIINLQEKQEEIMKDTMIFTSEVRLTKEGQELFNKFQNAHGIDGYSITYSAVKEFWDYVDDRCLGILIKRYRDDYVQYDLLTEKNWACPESLAGTSQYDCNDVYDIAVEKAYKKIFALLKK